MKSFFLILFLSVFSFAIGHTQSYVKLKTGKKIVGNYKVKKDAVAVKTAKGKESYTINEVEFLYTKKGVKKYPFYYTIKDGKKDKFGFFEKENDGRVRLFTQKIDMPSGRNHIVLILHKGELGAEQLNIFGVVGISKEEQKEVLLRYLGDNKEIRSKIETNLKDYTKTGYSKLINNLTNLLEEYNKE